MVFSGQGELWLKTVDHMLQLPHHVQLQKKTLWSHLAWPAWNLMIPFRWTTYQTSRRLVSQPNSPHFLTHLLPQGLYSTASHLYFNWLTWGSYSQMSNSFWCLATSWSALGLCLVNMGMRRCSKMSRVHSIGETGVRQWHAALLHIFPRCISLEIQQSQALMAIGSWC